MSSRQGSLLSTLESALQGVEAPCVAESGKLRLHTLFSIPRQVKTLYPLAHIHPLDVDKSRQRTPISAYLEQIFLTASWTPTCNDDEKGTSTTSTKSPILILALELYLYTLPAYGSAVLYISKLDSSGYGPASIPSNLRDTLSRSIFGSDAKAKAFGSTLTATIASAATQHFTTFRHWDAAPETSGKNRVVVSHVAVHILARSQQAYLFPSSPENKNKNVLSDGGLIKWWRDVMSHVIVQSHSLEEHEINTRAFYLIPGYSKNESHPLVPLVQQQQQTANASARQRLLLSSNWVYGHPYSPTGANCSPDNLPPLPLHWQRSAFIQQSSSSSRAEQQDPASPEYDPAAVRTVPTLMPHFSDDPKTRFLDETARDAHEHAGWKRKPSTNTGNDDTAQTNGQAHEANDGEGDAKRAKTGSDQVPSEKPGAAAAAATTTTKGGPPLVAVRASMRERASLDDLPVDEFWERMGFRQECCSGNAVGVIVCLFTRRPRTSASEVANGDAAATVERQPFSIPHKVLSDLVFHRLMRDVCEWNKEKNAIELTRSWFTGVDREVKRKGGITQHSTTEAKPTTTTTESSPDEEFVGRGQLWTDLVLTGPTPAMLDQAKKDKETAASQATNGASGDGPAAPTGNVLSVKRKKKPAT